MSISSSEPIQAQPRTNRPVHLALFAGIIAVAAGVVWFVMRGSPAAADYERGKRLAAIRMDADAKEAYEAAIKADPKYALPYRGLAELAETHNALPDAIGYWRKYIERAPNAVHARCKLAIIEQRAGEEVAALRDAEDELKHAPDCADAHLVAGTLYVRKQNAKIALEHLEPAAKAFRSSPQVQMELGRILALTASYDRAEEVLGNTLKLNSAHAEPYYWLGYIYAHRPASSDNSKKAVEYTRQALKLQPDYPEANVQLAQQLLRLGKPAEALPLANRAASVRKHFPPAYFALAESYAALGKDIESAAARQMFQRESDLAAREKACLKVYTAQPDNVENVLELSSTEMKRDRFQEALMFLQDAAAHNPGNARVQIALQQARQGAAKAPPEESSPE